MNIGVTSFATEQIYRVPLANGSNDSTIPLALNLLRPHFPHCLPLYRRLQFGRFLDASCILTSIRPADLLAPPAAVEALSKSETWLMAFVDRSVRPETELIMFGTWESASDAEAASQPRMTSLITALVLSAKRPELPPSIHQDSATVTDTSVDHRGFSRKEYGGHMANPNIMLWGGVHERTFRRLVNMNLVAKEFSSGLVGNHMYVFDVDAIPTPRELPEGLRWGKLESRHFALVKCRTQIPRQDKTMAVLPNLAIFPADSEKPISWAFVGIDGSLTTLHVEEAWRGRGLAKTLTTKLFREEMERFWEEGVPRLAYGHVIDGNEASVRTCQSIGGKSGWYDYWVRVDLSRVSQPSVLG